MKKKNHLLLAPAVALLLSLCACGISEDSSPASSRETKSLETGSSETDLIVFAAASMTEALTKLGDAYMAENPNVKIVLNFDSSGTLKTQIQEGAEVDILISAGQKQMDELDFGASKDVNTEGLDFVLEDTRFDILENEVVLAVPSDNPAGIHSFDDMIAGLKEGSILLAMGNRDVPVGQYSGMILAGCGLVEEDIAAAGSITYGTNAKEVTTQVFESAVDCGIIYQTDAVSAGLTVVDTATEEMCGQVIYPAAVMKVSRNPAEAVAFLEYLSSDAADAVFEEVGFTPVH